MLFQPLRRDVAFQQRVEFDDTFPLERSLVDLKADQSENGQDENGQYDDVTQTTNGLHQCADDSLETYTVPQPALQQDALSFSTSAQNCRRGPQKYSEYCYFRSGQVSSHVLNFV